VAEATFETVGEGQFRVSGELTFDTVTLLFIRSRPLFQTSAGQLDLDLGDVSRVDSAGLALLIEWLRAARKLGKAILFRRVPAQIRTIARVSDLDGILPFAPA
jgi:phospholipid transport system transporter-binding protein